MKIIRHCLECGTPISYGRSDKYFCNDACRSHYHNKPRNMSRNIQSKVVNILMRNYAVLSGLLEEKVTCVEVVDLVSLGYVPEYVTAHSRMGDKSEYRCFDIRFRMSGNRIFSIRRVELGLWGKE